MVDFAPFTRRILALAVAVVLVGSLIPVGITAQQRTNEPNDSRENATPIEVDISELVTVSGTLNNTVTEDNTVAERDVDFFKFNATAGQAINLYAGGDMLPEMAIYTPSGEAISLPRGSVDSRVAGDVAEETGTYYVRVSQNPSVQSQLNYGFSIEIVNPDTFEPNDAISNATPIQSNERVNGTIAKGDTDVFAVEADAGETIAASVALPVTEVVNPGNIAVDILNSNGERLNEASADSGGDLTNSTYVSGVTSGDTESVNVTVEEADIYYVRVQEAPGFNDFTDIGGFLKYGLNIETSGAAETPDNTDALVIIGGTPENKVTYEFTYEGDIERSGKSHGAPIEDRHVTIDRDIDEITDSRVSGRIGGGGDAYLITGEITGFELDGEASVYLNGEKIDPATFGSISDVETTATETKTATATRTPTQTATPTETQTTMPTRTQTPTETMTTTRTLTSTPSPTNVTSTESQTTNSTEQNGRILGETETDTSASSGPGFGFLLALVSLLVAGLLAARRR